jgi:hypothetical protein
LSIVWAGAVGHGVVDEGVVVDRLRAAAHEEAAEIARSTRLGQQHRRVVAHQRSTQGEGVGGEPAVALLTHVESGHVEVGVVLPLHDDEVDRSI